jgi:hypothetical protein
MFYSNTADTSGIEIKYNIFYDHTDWGSRYTSGWHVLPEIDCNLWYSEEGIMAYWFRDKLDSFDQYRRVTDLAVGGGRGGGTSAAPDRRIDGGGLGR